jgi:hypothetical protein
MHKTRTSQEPRTGHPAMRHFIGATVFYILNIVLSPVTLLGYVIWTGSLPINRSSGVSATAQRPLSAR